MDLYKRCIRLSFLISSLTAHPPCTQPALLAQLLLTLNGRSVQWRLCEMLMVCFVEISPLTFRPQQGRSGSVIDKNPVEKN